VRKSAVLVLNPPFSLVIINYIFVQEGINATYCLSSFEVKKAQTCNNFCAALLIEGGSEVPAVAGVSKGFPCPPSLLPSAASPAPP